MLSVSHILLLSGIKGFLYLDPGSGSVLLQVLIAAILGVGVVVRLQWARLKALFRSKQKPDEPPQHEE